MPSFCRSEGGGSVVASRTFPAGAMLGWQLIFQFIHQLMYHDEYGPNIYGGNYANYKYIYVV